MVDFGAEHADKPPIRCDRTKALWAVIAGFHCKPPFPPVCVEDGNSRSPVRDRVRTSGFKDYL